MLCWVSLVVQCLKLCPSNAGGTGSILGWEFSHTTRPKTKQIKVSVVLFFIHTFSVYESLYWEWVSCKQQRAGLVFGPLWHSILIGAFIYLLRFLYGLFLKSLLNLLQYCFCFMFWFFSHEVCWILAPQPGIQLILPALEGEVLITGLPGITDIQSLIIDIAILIFIIFCHCFLFVTCFYFLFSTFFLLCDLWFWVFDFSFSPFLAYWLYFYFFVFLFLLF